MLDRDIHRNIDRTEGTIRCVLYFIMGFLLALLVGVGIISFLLMRHFGVI